MMLPIGNDYIGTQNNLEKKTVFYALGMFYSANCDRAPVLRFKSI